MQIPSAEWAASPPLDGGGAALGLGVGLGVGLGDCAAACCLASLRAARCLRRAAALAAACTAKLACRAARAGMLRASPSSPRGFAFTRRELTPADVRWRGQRLSPGNLLDLGTMRGRTRE